MSTNNLNPYAPIEKAPLYAEDRRQSGGYSVRLEDENSEDGWQEVGLVSEDYSLHTLRHTFASWAVMAGTPIYTVSGWLGHSTVQVTEKYAHYEPERMGGSAPDWWSYISEEEAARKLLS